MTDDTDPHVILEQLHNAWAAATEETEAAWDALMASPFDQALRDTYYEKQTRSLEANQKIMEHKRRTGVYVE